MSADRRQHERISILAQVQVTHDGEVEILTATNLSVGGTFLEAAPDEHPEYQAGTPVDLMLCVSEENPAHLAEDGSVRTKGRIVRRDQGSDDRPAGIGIEFEQLDADNLSRLRLLLGRAKQD
jgi:hypothetical protein